MIVVAGEAGVDEAGCGSLIGNLVASAVILPDEFELDGVKDSKKLSGKRRKRVYDRIVAQARVGVGVVTREEIDQFSFAWARREVFVRALDGLATPSPSSIVVDGNGFFDGYNDIPHECRVKADTTHASVAAASIVAKVVRDAQITALCEVNADLSDTYGWKTNMGYPTKKHLDAIKTHGITPHHRLSFGPCKRGL